MAVIYCDTCKVNNLQCSKLFYPNGDEEWEEGDVCPSCGNDLDEAADFDAIP